MKGLRKTFFVKTPDSQLFLCLGGDKFGAS